MSELSKQNASNWTWAMRGIAGAFFALLVILYNNERESRMELVTSLKEVSQEVTEIENDLEEFQRDVIKNYTNKDEFAKNNEILLDISSSISELVERLIKLETKIEIGESK